MSRQSIYNTVESLISEVDPRALQYDRMAQYIVDMDLSLCATKLTHNDDPSGNHDSVKRLILQTIITGILALERFGMPPIKP